MNKKDKRRSSIHDITSVNGTTPDMQAAAAQQHRAAVAAAANSTATGQPVLAHQAAQHHHLAAAHHTMQMMAAPGLLAAPSMGTPMGPRPIMYVQQAPLQMQAQGRA